MTLALMTPGLNGDLVVWDINVEDAVHSREADDDRAFRG